MNSSDASAQSRSTDVSQWAFRRDWIVDTTTGPVVGHAETGVTAFRGIPYAEPPIGSLRFRRARPKTPWKEPFIAFKSGDKCVQVKDPKEGVIGSEDCLWLDVVVPREDPRHSIRDEVGARPVLVFLPWGF